MKTDSSDLMFPWSAPLDQKYLLGAEMQCAGHGAAFKKQMAVEEVASH